ncbi:MAG: 50S ribosomal protein L11 methyltransferase [Bacteroidota bacterium]
MQYVEVSITGLTGEKAEILTAELSELGFESFTEENEGNFSAFIPLDEFDIMKVAGFLEEKALRDGFKYKVEKIEEQNWNAVWESGYKPVQIENCLIRAPFHDPLPASFLDIIIEPKMSFGTAHHETTWLMIKTLLRNDFTGCSVLDMGTGTGVLAIIAAKLGADRVVAIDNDEWSFLNSLENVARNKITTVQVTRGTADDIPEGPYDFVFANINRNVLLNDIPVYFKVMAENARLYLSGFYEEDLEIIGKAARALGMQQAGTDSLNHWTVATFVK